jgi:gluconokinase
VSDAFRRAGGLAGRAIDIVAAALVAAVTVLVGAQVAVRYLLGGSLVWSEELTRLLFVWMVLIAATRAQPMRIDAFVAPLPRRLAAVLALVVDVVVFALTATLVWGAWGMAELTQGDSYIALDLSVSWVYVALWVSGALWLVRTLLEAAGHLALALGGAAP